MDAKTRQEIQRFQAGKDLLVDGIVGPKTRGAMLTALDGQCLVRPPSQVKFQQRYQKSHKSFRNLL